MEVPRKPGSGARRRAGFGAKLLLVGAVLAFCLLVVEVGLRIAGVPSLECQFVSATFDGELFVEDPDRLWRLSPTCDKFAVNEVGLRGWWPEGPAPDGELRILCVGDSCTFGTGVLYEETYGVALAQTLSNSRLGVPARAVLLALPGYSTYQDLVLLEQYAEELQPDLVVLYCGAWNDYLPAWLRTDAEWGEVTKSGVFSRLAELGKRAIWSSRHRDPAQLVVDYKDGGAPPLLRVPLEEYQDNLRSLIRVAAQAGAQPLVVLPAFPAETLVRFPTGGRYLEATRAVLREVDVPSVDATAVIERFEREQEIRDVDASGLSFTDWIHPSGIGHGLIARAISAELESIGWPERREDAPGPLARPQLRCEVLDEAAQVTWSAVNGAEGYSIYFEELSSGKIGAVDCGARTSFAMPVPAGARFRFCVVAHRWGGRSPCSETVAVGR